MSQCGHVASSCGVPCPHPVLRLHKVTISQMFCVPLTYNYIYICVCVCMHACRQAGKHAYIDRLSSTIVLPVCSDLKLLSSPACRHNAKRGETAVLGLIWTY